MAATVKELDLIRDVMKPTPRQLEALRAIVAKKFTLYGGSGGGGKSYLLRWALLFLLLHWFSQGHEGVRVALFSMDYPTLKDRQISKINREFPEYAGKVVDDKVDGLCFKLHPQYGGGAILLRNLDDPAKYKSAEFAAVAVEELTENEEQVFHDLHFRLRWPGITDTKFIAATNPNGIGHLWCKRFWITKELTPELLEQYTPDQFAYVPARVTDNPHVDPSYLRTLDALPEDMRKAVRDGDWDLVQGMSFSEWRRHIHVVKPFDIPSYWQVFGSNDPGYNDPGVWYVYAVDSDGNVHVCREWSFHRVPYSDQARAVAKDELAQRANYWVTGMDAFTPHPETQKSYIDYYHEGGLSGFMQPDHGAGAIRRRTGTIHEYLAPFKDHEGKERARLRVFESCKKLIETLPAIPTDPNQPDQYAGCAIDHWPDALGYGLRSRHGMGEGAPGPKPRPGSMLDRLGDPMEMLAKSAAADRDERSDYERNLMESASDES